MKKYFIFAYNDYEALGGMRDYIGCTNCKQAAIRFSNRFKKIRPFIENIEVWDMDEMESAYKVRRG